MNNEIVLQIDSFPRIKEKYRYDNNIPLEAILPESKSSKITMFFIGEDFRDELTDSIYISLQEVETKSFPIVGSVSVFMDLYSDRNISIIGVLKNVLDAGNKLLYQDDVQVESALVRKHSADGGPEKLILSVISSRVIDDLDAETKDYSPYIILNLELETVLEDRYLPYPKCMNTTDVAEVNQRHDDKVSIQLKQHHGSTLMTKNAIELSLVMNMHDKKADVDNLALTYVKCCKGIIYESIDQIQILHLVLFLQQEVISQTILLCFYYLYLSCYFLSHLLHN